MIKNVFLPLIVVLLLTIGQTGFKLVGNKFENGINWSSIWSARYEFLVVMSVYALATILWIYVLSYMPLSRAFSYYAAVFIIVPLLAHVFFGEDVFNRQFLFGTAIIVLGVLITVRA